MKKPVTKAKPAAFPLPKLAKGEIYAGAIIGPDGKGAHVVLLPGDKDNINWADAMAWAKKQGGDLPNRVEQALLFAHHKNEFEQRWYWSNTQLASVSDFAWMQSFSTGNQTFSHESYEARARAVRRVPL